MDLIDLLKERVGLAGRSVLEVGCGDGRHTAELCRAAESVLAVDGRQEHLDTTATRVRGCGIVDLILGDVEDVLLPRADVVFHVGVLYHLADPVDQLVRVSKAGRVALLLDTHYSLITNNDYLSREGHRWFCKDHHENPALPREGLRRHSRRLLLTTILTILGDHWEEVSLADDRVERNGPRATILCQTRKLS